MKLGICIAFGFFFCYQVFAQTGAQNAFNPSNLAPVAVNDTVEVKPGSQVNVYVLRNDYDVDRDTLRVVEATPGLHSERVVINSNGTIHYRPFQDYKGDDQFTYTVSDGRGGNATATVFVSVVDHPPKVNRLIATQTFFFDQPHQVDLGGRQPVIFDPQGEPLRFAVESADSSVVIPQVQGYTVTLTGVRAGYTSVRVAGEDSLGQTAATSFFVVVKDPAPIFGMFHIELLLESFNKDFGNHDYLALTGPIHADTLGGRNRGYTYLSILPQTIAESEILALRRNLDQILLQLLNRGVRLRFSFDDVDVQSDVAHIKAHLRYESVGTPSPPARVYLALPPGPVSLKAIKTPQGKWVMDDISDIVAQIVRYMGIGRLPKIKWQVPDITLSVNTPPLVFDLEAEPRWFVDEDSDVLHYTTSTTPGPVTVLEPVLRNHLLVLTPVSQGETVVRVVAEDSEGNQELLHFRVNVRNDVPVARVDSVSVASGEAVDIAVLNNDSSPTAGRLRVVRATAGAKSASVNVLDARIVRYQAKRKVSGTDWILYSVKDDHDKQADGAVFVHILPSQNAASPDFDQSGAVDFQDFLLFSLAYNSDDIRYDLDGDGWVGFSDFLDFARAFAR